MDAPMLAVACPSCRRRFRAPSSLVGKRVRCPGCDTAVVVAPTSASGAVPVATPAALEPSAGPFDFDHAPAAPPDPARADPELPPGCALCGDCESRLEPFFLRGIGQDGAVVRWVNFRAKCCAECFRAVSSAQQHRVACNVGVGLGALIAAAAALLALSGRLPGVVAGLAFLPLAAALVVLAVVWDRRRRLLQGPALKPVLKRLRFEYHKATGLWEVEFVPLASVGDGDDIFELDR